MYAFLDNQYHREEKEKETFAVTKDVLRDMSVKKFLELEDQEINNFLDRESFPKKIQRR